VVNRDRPSPHDVNHFCCYCFVRPWNRSFPSVGSCLSLAHITYNADEFIFIFFLNVTYHGILLCWYVSYVGQARNCVYMLMLTWCGLLCSVKSRKSMVCTYLVMFAAC
jgi:hypothetical protein